MPGTWQKLQFQPLPKSGVNEKRACLLPTMGRRLWDGALAKLAWSWGSVTQHRALGSSLYLLPAKAVVRKGFA